MFKYLEEVEVEARPCGHLKKFTYNSIQEILVIKEEEKVVLRTDELSSDEIFVEDLIKNCEKKEPKIHELLVKFNNAEKKKCFDLLMEDKGDVEKLNAGQHFELAVVLARILQGKRELENGYDFRSCIGIVHYTDTLYDMVKKEESNDISDDIINTLMADINLVRQKVLNPPYSTILEAVVHLRKHPEIKRKDLSIMPGQHFKLENLTQIKYMRSRSIHFVFNFKTDGDFTATGILKKKMENGLYVISSIHRIKGKKAMASQEENAQKRFKNGKSTCIQITYPKFKGENLVDELVELLYNTTGILSDDVVKKEDFRNSVNVRRCDGEMSGPPSAIQVDLTEWCAKKIRGKRAMKTLKDHNMEIVECLVKKTTDADTSNNTLPSASESKENFAMKMSTKKPKKNTDGVDLNDNHEPMETEELKDLPQNANN